MAAYNNYNRGSAFCFITILIFAASNPIAEAQVLNVNGLSISGSLCCTPTGNCPGGRPLFGVPVRLNCANNLLGVSTTVGRTTTDVYGRFNFAVPGLLAGVFSVRPVNIPCNVIVQLPVNSVACPVLNTATGTLTSTVRSLGTTVNSALGLLRNAAINGFVNANVGV